MAKVTNASNAKILTERQRQLQPIDFAPSTTLTRDLNRDSTLKYLMLTLAGSFVTTYASGTPLADAQSTFDNLVDNINITVNGSRIVKSVRPHLMAIQQLMAYKVGNDRRCSAGAAAAVFPSVEGGFVYGTTGQISSVYESILIPFVNILADNRTKDITWLNLRGVSSAEIRLTTKAFTSLLAFGNTAPMVVSAYSSLKIYISTIEAQDVDADTVFSDWKQSTKTVSFSAGPSSTLVDIPRGNLLQSLLLFAQDGAAGGATTAAGNLATNLLVGDLKLKLNGQQDIKATNFLTLQSENRQRFGLVAPVASNVSRLDGIALFDFTKDGDLTTCLDCRAPLVDSVQLEVSVRGGSEFSYNASKPATLTIMTNEIVQPA